MSTSGYQPGVNYALGGGTPTPAGALDANGGVQFWSPNKYAMIVDSRAVPGMQNKDDAGNSQFVQAKSGSSLGAAMNQLLTIGQNSPDIVQSLQESLIKGGFLDPTKKSFQLGAVNSGDPTYNAYYNLLENSIRTGTDYNAILQNRIANDAGKKYESAFKAQQDKLAKQQAAAAAALLPQTINRSATNISDPLTAQTLVTQMLQSEIGRAPDASELQSFTQALQTAQAQNPTLTTAVTDPGQVQDKTSTQTGGFDKSQFTQNYIDQNFAGEKAAVGGATGFYSAALSALGAGGRGY